MKWKRWAMRGRGQCGSRSRGGAWTLVVFLLLSRTARAGLEGEIRALIPKHGLKPSQVAVCIFLEGESPAVSINARVRFRPASNLKILTTAAGVSSLGIDYRYETTISATSPLKGGVIDGDLVVRGTGDPNISGRFYDDDPVALFRQWARRLHQAGIRDVKGDIVADDRWFDDVRMPPSWSRDSESAWYSAQVSALNINDNCLDVTVTPAAKAGDPARVAWVPFCPLVRVSGAPTTVARGETAVGLARRHGTNDVRLFGRIRAGKSRVWKGNVTIDDPALLFVATLAEVLRKEGIQIEGRPRRIDRRAEDAGGGPPARLLIRHTSTLRLDLPIINKRSQNLHAEALLRALGAEFGGGGSVAGGEQAIRSFLRRHGISSEALVLRDGCGLSREDRVTADLLARVLRAMMRLPCFDEYRASFAVAGVDGTLHDRFKTSPVRGKVFAKTGYIAGVSCLSGYVVRGERTACFSILVNGIGGSAGAKRFQERAAEAIWRTLGR